MKAHASEEQVRAVCERIESLGYRAHPIPGAQRTAIGITGNKGAMEPGALEEMSGVQEVIQVSKPYKLVSRDAKEEDTVIRFAGSDGSFGDCDLALSPDPARLNPANRLLRSLRGWHRAARVFSAAAHISPAPRLMHFKVWGRWPEDHGGNPRALWAEDYYRSTGRGITPPGGGLR